MNEIETQEPHRKFIFATEESFGFLNHQYARDKDAISSITLLSELALWYKERGLNIIQALDELYKIYGYSCETLKQFVFKGKEGTEKITKIMDYFRTNTSDFKIHKKEDYLNSIVKDFTTNEETKLHIPKSNVLGYHLQNGIQLYLRPSGTEPKIKFYIMILKNSGKLEDQKKSAQKETQNIIQKIQNIVDKI